MKNILSQIKPYRFRILSVMLLVVVLVSTWFIFHKKPQYSEELHINLQEQFKELIRKSLAEQKPQAKNLQFQNVTTQMRDRLFKPSKVAPLQAEDQSSLNKEDESPKAQVKATFEYSFEEDSTRVSVEGFALMNRVPTEENYDLWVVKHIQAGRSSLQFEEPIVLQVRKSETENPTKPTSPTEPSTEVEPPNEEPPTSSGDKN